MNPNRRTASSTNLVTPINRPFKPSFGGGGSTRKRSFSSNSLDRRSSDCARNSASGGGAVAKPFFGTSTSGARQSSIYGKSNYGGKDPRLCDDSCCRKWAQELSEFAATTLEYKKVSEQELFQPKAFKEIQSLAEHMFAQIDASLTVTKPDDIPLHLKSLGYPFEIKKSDMATPTTPRCWPKILAALIWLKEFMLYAFNLDAEKLLFPTNFGTPSEPESRHKNLFDFHTASFKAEDEEQMKDLERLFHDVFQGEERDTMKALEQEHSRLSEEYRTLSSQRPLHEELQEQNDKLQKDEQELQKYIQDMQAYVVSRKERVDALTEKSKDMETDIQQLLASVAQKEQIVAKQEISPADLQNLIFQRQELERIMQTLNTELEQERNRCWNEETDLAKDIQRIESLGSEFVQRAKQLTAQIMPANLATVEHSLSKFSVHDAKFDQLCETEYMPSVNFLKEMCSNDEHAVRSALVEIRKSEAKLEEQINAFQIDAEKLERQLVNSKNDAEIIKQEKTSEMSNVMATLETKRAEHERLVRLREMPTHEVEQEKTRLLKEKVEQEKRFKKEKQTRIRDLTNLLKVATSHKEKIDKLNEDFNNELKETVLAIKSATAL